MSLTNLQKLDDTGSDSAYKQQRFTILKLLEGNIPTPYFDKKGFITIGIGFEIDNNTGNRDLVLGTKGMNLSAAQQDIINVAFKSSRMAQIKALPQATKAQRLAKDEALGVYLNSVLGSQPFSMTDPQIKGVFDVLVQKHQDAISTLISDPSIEKIILTLQT